MVPQSRIYLFLFLAFAWKPTLAQQPAPPLPSQFDHIQGLTPFIGAWEGEYQAPNGPKGKLKGVCSWENNRSYANFIWTFTAKGSPVSVHPFSIRIGFNGTTQAPHFWVTSWEGQAEGPALIESDGVTLAGNGVQADGSKASRKVVYKLDGDSMTVTQTDFVVDGKQMPDETMVLHRIGESSKLSTKELLSEVQGTWKLEQEDGKWTTKTITGNKSKLLRYNADGTVRAGHDTEFTLEELDGVKVYRPIQITRTEGPGKGTTFTSGPRSGYVYTIDDNTWTEAQGLMSHSNGNVRVFQWKRVNDAEE
jgi:hypothetical protein